MSGKSVHSRAVIHRPQRTLLRLIWRLPPELKEGGRMITSIAIENFKAIRDRVRIELKPITLLFGPNSSGKSSVIHALHYAREVFERRNLDADKTISGDGVVDLGGFRNFVHGRQLSRAVVLRFDLDLSSGNIDLEEYTVVAFDNPAAVRLPLAHRVEITQLIPVVTLALMGPAFASIEQPELHLHPALPVRLGELLIHVANQVGWNWHRLLVETHSEHLLLRLLRRIRETNEGELPANHSGLTPDMLSVVYVEPPADRSPEPEKPGIQVRHLRIDETGEFFAQP
jgi:hypothetical protein